MLLELIFRRAVKSSIAKGTKNSLDVSFKFDNKKVCKFIQSLFSGKIKYKSNITIIEEDQALTYDQRRQISSLIISFIT